MEETDSFQNHVRAFLYFSEINEFFVRGGRLGQDFPNQQYGSMSRLPRRRSKTSQFMHIVHVESQRGV